MNHTILVITFWLTIVPSVDWRIVDLHPHSSETITQSSRSVRCFRDSELSELLATLKQQGGADVANVSQALLSKARRTQRCRTEVVQALIKGMEQASQNIKNSYDNYFFFQHGANLLAELKATEALDLLVANIDLNDNYPSSLDDFPALVAIFRIKEPALPKLQVLLNKDLDPGRRKFAALAIAYIGGSQARKALTSALLHETDPCVKKFLEVSVQAFDNKERPNHISSELNGRWLSAFYCL